MCTVIVIVRFSSVSAFQIIRVEKCERTGFCIGHGESESGTRGANIKVIVNSRNISKKEEEMGCPTSGDEMWRL